MRTPEFLPELKFRILCKLADGQGHTAREIEEILNRENKKLCEEECPHLPTALIFDKKTGKILGKTVAKTQKPKIYKSNLSVELNEMRSDGIINRESRDKPKKEHERGHNSEFAYYIPQDKYSYIDQRLLADLRKIKGNLSADMMGETKRTNVKNMDGSISTMFMPIVDISNSYPACQKQIKRFFQWNRSKKPKAFDKYIQAALDSAEYKTVENGRPYIASIPAIPDLIEIGGIDKEDCREQMKSYLEELIAIKLYCGLEMPKIGGIALPHSHLS